MRGGVVIGVAVGESLVASTAWAQAPARPGEAVYKQHCAGCHNGSLPHMPTREALRGLTPEHIATALSFFTMRRQGASLSPVERRAVSEFLAGRPTGSYKAPLDAIAKTAIAAPPSRGRPARSLVRPGTGGESTRATHGFSLPPRPA